MKSVKILSALCATAVVATMGATTAFAASPNYDVATSQSNFVQSSTQSVQGEKGEKRDAALKGKIAALTDEQKAELQAIRAQGEGSKTIHIDKLLEFGVIDEATATQMKDQTAQSRGEEGRTRPTLTPEQTAENQANKAELESKIAALTDEQRAELETIKSQGKGSRDAYIDKLLEFEVIDQDTATKMMKKPAPKGNPSNTNDTSSDVSAQQS